MIIITLIILSFTPRRLGSYPIVTKEDYLKASRKERFVYLLVRHPLTITFWLFLRFPVRDDDSFPSEWRQETH